MEGVLLERRCWWALNSGARTLFPIPRQSPGVAGRNDCERDLHSHGAFRVLLAHKQLDDPSCVRQKLQKKNKTIR